MRLARLVTIGALLALPACSGAGPKSTSTDGGNTPGTGTPDPDPDSGIPDGVEAPIYSGTWERPTYAALESLDMPPGPTGEGYTFIEANGATLWLDPTLRDPVTAAGACATVMLACISDEERNTHGCLIHGPQCATDTPWTEDTLCCPAACTTAYQQRRVDGMSEDDALVDAIFGDSSCIPTLDEATTVGAR